MPRDGSNIYHRPPGTDAVPDTTIESTKYNSNVADVEQDLNAPRPIVAGGTGASDAHTAMVNLNGEIANQIVTNYDSFPFVAGSFTSAPGATAAPAANGIAGIYYDNGAGWATVEARDLVSGILYVRLKQASVWQAWAAQAGSTASLDTAYVNVAGDTMTGNLAVAPTATTGTYYFGTSGTKYLNYDGTNFTLTGGPLVINANLTVNAANILASNITSNGNLVGAAIQSGLAATGIYYFGNTGTKYLTYDGTKFLAVGGQFTIDSPYLMVGTGTTGNIYFGSTGTRYLNYDGTNFNLVGGNLYATGGFVDAAYFSVNSAVMPNAGINAPFASGLGLVAGGQESMRFTGSGGVGRANAFQAQFTMRTNALSFKGTSTSGVQTFIDFADVNFTQCGAINVDQGAHTTAYQTTSDERGKPNRARMVPREARAIIDALQVWDYDKDGNSIRGYGVIAQQAYEVHKSLASPPANPDEWWMVEKAAPVPFLIAALQNANQHIDKLEARLTELEAKLTKPQ